MHRFRPRAKTISVKMPPDEKGMVGRKCPRRDCQKYFKLKPGTGLKGDVPCHCPYCGHVGGSDDFWTPEQKKYAEAVAMNYASEEIHRMLKGLEFETKIDAVFQSITNSLIERESECAKLRAPKQGLMQEWLTGRQTSVLR